MNNRDIGHLVKLVSLVLIGLLSACANTRVYPPNSIVEGGPRANAPGPGAPTPISPTLAFDKAVTDAKASGGAVAAENINRLLHEGSGLIEVECATFFDRLGSIQQDLGFIRKETSLVGGVAAAALGLAGQSPKFIANTAAGFGLATSSMDSYQDSFLFSPDVGALQTMIEKSMADYKAKNLPATGTTFSEAMGYLVKYEAICQPQGIRAQVNQAVANSKPQTPSTGTTTPLVAALSNISQTTFQRPAPGSSPLLVNVLLTGTNFVDGKFQINPTPKGITFPTVTVNSSSSAVAQISIGPDAPTGSTRVQVSNIGQSGSQDAGQTITINP